MLNKNKDWFEVEYKLYSIHNISSAVHSYEPQRHEQEAIQSHLFFNSVHLFSPGYCPNTGPLA